jgi:tetratricopeptide (TPR) repeat protein
MKLLKYKSRAIGFAVMVFILCHTYLAFSQNKVEMEKLKSEAKGVRIDSYNSTLKICKYYWNYSFDSSIVYARRAIKLSKSLNNDSLESLANIYMALSYNYIDQLDSALYYCAASKKSSHNYPRLTAKANSILGITYRKLGDFKMGLKYGNMSVEMFEEAHDSLNYATSLGNVSTTLQEMGNATKAINYSLHAAKIFKTLNDSFDLAKRYGTIANIYLDMFNLKKGIEYYNLGISLVDSTKHKGLYITFVFNMATVYHQLHKYDSAIYFYNISLNHYKQSNDREGVAIANQDIGLSLIGKSEYRKAINYLQNAFLLFSNLYTVRNVSDVLCDLGLAYSSAGISDSAVIYMQMSVDTSIKYNLLREELKARKLLYEVYKTRGELASALKNFEKYKVIEDSIFSQNTKEKMAELSMEYEAGLKDEKIKQLVLNERITQAKTRTYIIVLISVTILFVLLATILYYRKRTQNKVLSIKAKLWEKEKAELDKELKFKKKQLSSHALHMTQKNKLLQNIRVSINNVMPLLPDSTKGKIRELQQELNKSLRYDKDWEVFSIYFNELNKDFFEKLTAINPKLSQYDLRLASLLRMNMNIKEAAAVLNIEPDSVKTARYKLRKKLALKAEDDLVKFITNL